MNWERMTLPVLLAQWARSVDFLGRAPITDAEFASDVLLRHEIALRLQTQPVTRETREMLAEVDDTFRAATVATASCVLSDERAASWSPTREWYGWRALAADPRADAASVSA